VTARHIIEAVLLSGVVLTCWIAVIGMLRMREPMQALHYISLPATVGAFLLTLAVFVSAGNSAVSWKTAFLAAVLFGINSVVAHATARAFRTRECGHWEPRPGDDVDWVQPTGDGA
jgi:monovalent cation/proton antiporter MnhG/PhaG subunit